MRTSVNFAYLVGFQTIQFVGQPFRKQSTSSSLSQTFVAKHSIRIVVLEVRELSHSHPQFPRTTLETPGTMIPHFATKYDYDERRGISTEARVKIIQRRVIIPQGRHRVSYAQQS